MAAGRVWRIARPIDTSVLRQVSETDVGKQAVLVFVAAGPGTTTVSFGLTRGERFWAYESRRYTVSVQSYNVLTRSPRLSLRARS